MVNPGMPVGAAHQLLVSAAAPPGIDLQGVDQHQAAERAQQDHVAQRDDELDLALLAQQAEHPDADGGAGEAADQQNEPHLHVRSEEHTSELQSLMRISYAVFCLKKKTNNQITQYHTTRPH